MNAAQRRAVDFFNKMRERELLSLQPESFYQESNEVEHRRRLEAGRHFHHDCVSTRIKYDHPKFSELQLVWTITGY